MLSADHQTKRAAPRTNRASSTICAPRAMDSAAADDDDALVGAAGNRFYAARGLLGVSAATPNDYKIAHTTRTISIFARARARPRNRARRIAHRRFSIYKCNKKHNMGTKKKNSRT